MKGPHAFSTPTAALLTIAVGGEHPARESPRSGPRSPSFVRGSPWYPSMSARTTSRQSRTTE